MTEKANDNLKISWGTLLLLGSILATTVTAFAYVKAQATVNGININSHKADDEKKWNKHDVEVHDIRIDIDKLSDLQTEIRISQREQATHYAQILREVEKLNIKFDKFEVTE